MKYIFIDPIMSNPKNAMPMQESSELDALLKSFVKPELMEFCIFFLPLSLVRLISFSLPLFSSLKILRKNHIISTLTF